MLMDGETGDVLAHEMVPKAEHHFGRPHVMFKYMAPARVMRHFREVLARPGIPRA